MIALNFLDRKLNQREKTKLVWFSKLDEPIHIFTMIERGYDRLRWNGRLYVKGLYTALYNEMELPKDSKLLLVTSTSDSYMLIARCPYPVWAIMIDGSIIFT